MFSDKDASKGEGHESERRTNMVMRSSMVNLVIRMMHLKLISPVSRASNHMPLFLTDYQH